MRALVWKLHQWLGLITCTGILMWGVSGVMHPIMSRLQPQPVQFMPPRQSVTLSSGISLMTVLQQQRINHFQHVSIATIQGQPYYRIQLLETFPARYYSTREGHELPDGDRLYAEQLARHYTGLSTTPIENSRFVTQFDVADYDAVNKLLPVWSVAFADQDNHLRAYIDTHQARLATLSNPTRQYLTRTFRFLHTWTFLDSRPYLQVIIMTFVLICALFSALSGIYFYVALRSNTSLRLHNRPLNRWHRTLGIIVSMATLSSVTSGTFHLLHKFQHEKQTDRFNPLFDTHDFEEKSWATMTAQPLAQLSLAKIDNHAVWIATPAVPGTFSGPRAQVANLAVSENDEHAHHKAASSSNQKKYTPSVVKPLIIDSKTGLVLKDGMNTLVRQLAAYYAHQPITDIEKVVRVIKFEGEYGFFFKRLPVYKVAFKGNTHPRYYVEPATGVLVARIDDRDALEGQSFAYLHKWHFTEGGKDLRDFLLALFAFGNVVVASLGFYLFIKFKFGS